MDNFFSWGFRANELVEKLSPEFPFDVVSIYTGRHRAYYAAAEYLTKVIVPSFEQLRDDTRALFSKVFIQDSKHVPPFLKNLDNVNKELIASMGWCFGGGMSLQLALNEKLAATIIYYGSLETNATKLEAIKWPVLGIFGSLDTSIPVDTVKKFEAALNEVGIENEIHIYEGVGHAFANPSGMNYAPNETKDAWKKTVEFLNRNLK